MLLKFGCVTLRAIEEKDCDLLMGMMNNQDIDKKIGDVHLPVSRREQEEWIRSFRNTDSLIRLIIELQNGCALGTIMLYNIDFRNSHAEIGIKIDTNNKNERIPHDTDDAYQALLDYAYNELNLNCIYSYILKDNIASVKFHLRNGFSESGTIPQKIFSDGKYKDIVIFYKLRNNAKAD